MGVTCTKHIKNKNVNFREKAKNEDLNQLEKSNTKIKNFTLKDSESRKKSASSCMHLQSSNPPIRNSSSFISGDKFLLSSPTSKNIEYNSEYFLDQLKEREIESCDELEVASEDDIFIEEAEIKKFLHLDSDRSQKFKRKIDLEVEFIDIYEEEISFSDENNERSVLRKSEHVIKMKKLQTGTTKNTEGYNNFSKHSYFSENNINEDVEDIFSKREENLSSDRRKKVLKVKTQGGGERHKEENFMSRGTYRKA